MFVLALFIVLVRLSLIFHRMDGNGSNVMTRNVAGSSGISGNVGGSKRMRKRKRRNGRRCTRRQSVQWVILVRFLGTVRFRRGGRRRFRSEDDRGTDDAALVVALFMIAMARMKMATLSAVRWRHSSRQRSHDSRNSSGIIILGRASGAIVQRARRRRRTERVRRRGIVVRLGNVVTAAKVVWNEGVFVHDGRTRDEFAFVAGGEGGMGGGRAAHDAELTDGVAPGATARPMEGRKGNK
mmetsp:Transcript_27776/g.58828  ORF Transcript_27776/g.58828 Transcript_27776/m.58828 type:complete len:239 (-) Transcript_27776:266-982(-)